MNNTKQKNVYYEYEITIIDEDDETVCSYDNNFWLGDETPLLEKAIELKNNGSFKISNSRIEIVQWNEEYEHEYMARDFQSCRCLEIYPNFGRDSSLKYKNLPKHIQKEINIIRKALA